MMFHIFLGSFVKSLAFGQMSLHLPEQTQKQFGFSACVTYTTSNCTDEVTWLHSHQWNGAFTDVSAVISTLELSNSQTTIRSWGFLCKAINASKWFKIKPSWSIAGLASSVLSVFTCFCFPPLHSFTMSVFQIECRFVLCFICKPHPVRPE